MQFIAAVSTVLKTNKKTPTQLFPLESSDFSIVRNHNQLQYGKTKTSCKEVANVKVYDTMLLKKFF